MFNSFFEKYKNEYDFNFEGSNALVIQNFDCALKVVIRENTTVKRFNDTVQNRSFCCNFLQALASYGVKLCTTLSSPILNSKQLLESCSESIQTLSFIAVIFELDILKKLKEFYPYEKWLNLNLSIIDSAFNLAFELEIAQSDFEEVQRCRKLSYLGLKLLLVPSIAVRFLAKATAQLHILVEVRRKKQEIFPMASSLVRETNAWLLSMSRELLADESVFNELFAWTIQLQYFVASNSIEYEQLIEIWNILSRSTCLQNLQNQFVHDNTVSPIVYIIRYFCPLEKTDSDWDDGFDNEYDGGSDNDAASIQSASISSRAVPSILNFLRIVLLQDIGNNSKRGRVVARELLKKLWNLTISNVCRCGGVEKDRSNLLSLFQILSSTVNSNIKQLELSLSDIVNNGACTSSSIIMVDTMFGFCFDALLELSSSGNSKLFLPQLSGLLRATAIVSKKVIFLHNKSTGASSVNLSDIATPLIEIMKSVEVQNGAIKGVEEFVRVVATITLVIESHRLSMVYSPDIDSAGYDVIIGDVRLLSVSLSTVQKYCQSLPSEASAHVELKGYCDKMVKIIMKILLHIPSIIAIEWEQSTIGTLGDIVSELFVASPVLLHRIQSQFISEVQELSAERLLGISISQLLKCFDCICSALFKVEEESQCQLNYYAVMKMVTKCAIMISREHAIASREQHVKWKMSFLGLCDDLMTFAVALDPDIIVRLPNSTALKLKGSTTGDAKKKGTSKGVKTSGSSGSRHVNNVSAMSSSDRIVYSLTCFRMWLLLSLCSSPYMGAHGFLSSTSTDSHCVFLSSAMKALEDAVSGLSNLSNEMSGQSASISTFAESNLRVTVKQLYYLLDLQGRLPDQVALVRLGKEVGRLCGNCGDIFEEIHALMLIKMTLYGLPKDDVIYEHTSAVKFLHRVNDFLSESTKMLCRQLQESSLVVMDVEKVQETAVYVESTTNLIDYLSTSTIHLGERWTLLLQCWITIVCAKTLFIGYYDPTLSYQWAKRFFIHFSKIKSSAHRSAKQGSRVLGDIPSHLSADLVPLALEAVLLLAELHEHTGNVDSCLSYISEATALTKVQDRDSEESCTVLSTYHNLVTLHTVRVWFRISSPRFQSYLEETLIVEDQNRTSMKDDVSNRVRYVLWSISDCLNLDIDKVYRKNTSREVEHANFRFASLFWDLSGIRSRCSITSSDCSDMSEEARMQIYWKNSIFHTFLPPSIRKEYSRFEYIDTEDKSLLVSSNSCRGNVRALPFTEKVNDDILAYDFKRDLRRKLCRAVLRRSCESSALISFICGASSCFVSLECDFERRASSICEKNHSTSSKVSITASSFSRFIDVVEQSVRGDIASCVLIQQRLRKWLRYATPVELSPSSSSAVCFACMEPTTDSLLLGRLDGAQEYVVSIPIGNAMATFLAEWRTNMESGEALLRQTTNSEAVSKWTEKEKKVWWDRRTQHDSTLADLLHRLQGLLGPWRFLFGARNNIATASAEQHTASSAHRFTEMKTASDVPVAEVYQDVSHWVDLLCRNASSREHNDVVAALSAVITSTYTVGMDASQAGNIADHFARIWWDIHQPKTNAESMADKETTCADYDSMKVTDLRALLKDRGMSTVGKKGDLIQRLQESSRELDVEAIVPLLEDDSSNDSSPTGQIVLILDESLQQLPWECIPYLANTRCSRVPNLALLLSLIDDDHAVTDRAATEDCVIKDKSKLASNKRSSSVKVKVKVNKEDSKAIKSMRVEREISARSCWYAVDIEGNLPMTRAVMVPFLHSYSSMWEWKGVVAELPSEEELRFFHENTELFIFCGHGAGDKMCESSHFRKYKSCPAAMLWGCSSGHLRAMGYHDPTGPALHYLLAGAPFTLGNLWDVTDKDIDKLSIECMKSVFGAVDDDKKPISGDVCEALVVSRNVCKLKNAVGCAPVVYGLPYRISSSRDVVNLITTF